MGTTRRRHASSAWTKSSGRPCYNVLMMSLDPIERTTGLPPTVDSLAGDLAALGVEAGSTLLVHCSLRELGWVVGGPVAVVGALDRVLGANGTLVMPAHSGDLSDPAGWREPPVPEPWWDVIRRNMPPFDRHA